MTENGNVMMENKDIVIISREPVVGANRWGGYITELAPEQRP